MYLPERLVYHLAFRLWPRELAQPLPSNQMGVISLTHHVEISQGYCNMSVAWRSLFQPDVSEFCCLRTSKPPHRRDVWRARNAILTGRQHGQTRSLHHLQALFVDAQKRS